MTLGLLLCAGLGQALETTMTAQSVRELLTDSGCSAKIPIKSKPETLSAKQSDQLAQIEANARSLLGGYNARVDVVGMECGFEGLPFAVGHIVTPLKCEPFIRACNVSLEPHVIVYVALKFLERDDPSLIDWASQHVYCAVMRSSEFSNNTYIPKLEEVEACVSYKLGRDVDMHAYYYLRYLEPDITGEAMIAAHRLYSEIIKSSLDAYPVPW